MKEERRKNEVLYIRPTACEHGPSDVRGMSGVGLLLCDRGHLLRHRLWAFEYFFRHIPRPRVERHQHIHDVPPFAFAFTQTAHMPPGLDSASFQQAFFDAFDPPQQFHKLFDHLSGVIFFTKDTQGRLMGGSPAMVQRLRLADESQLIGLEDHEFFPPHIVEGFLRDDQHVITTGKPLLGRIEVWLNELHVFDWFVTNKAPIFGRSGAVIGVMGTVCNLDERRDALFAGARISRAIQFIQDHYSEKLEIEKLAQLSCLSTRQFRRQFHQLLCMSPQVFVLKTRMQAACKALMQTDTPLAEIALNCGFSDQSAFTHHFRRLLGVTPMQFRRQSVPRPMVLAPALSYR